MKKALDTILTVVLVIVLVLVGLISIMLISSSANSGVASVFGYSPIVLYDTKSMEPTFGANDLIIIKEQDTSALKEGDIISFWGIVDNERSIITHRIVEVISLNDGTVCYQTKGDNPKQMVDQDPNNIYRQPDIYPNDIIGVYVTHIGGFGKVLNFIKTPNGILICFVIPLALLLFWQIARVIRLIIKMNHDKQDEKAAEMSEEEKKRVIEEYLRAQAAQNDNADNTP